MTAIERTAELPRCNKKVNGPTRPWYCTREFGHRGAHYHIVPSGRAAKLRGQEVEQGKGQK